MTLDKIASALNISTLNIITFNNSGMGWARLFCSDGLALLVLKES